jgi:hypothetical protein
MVKTEGVIKNGHSRDSGNIGHTTNKPKYTTQKIIKINNTSPTNKPRVNHALAKGNQLLFLIRLILIYL